MPHSSGEKITIPSPIDVHVHLREPGGENRETIASGTYAALRGGYQAVFDMPNNPNNMETWSKERLAEKMAIAKRDARVGIGFYAGTSLENPDFGEFPKMIELGAAGLKLYMGHTTGNVKEYGLDEARSAIEAWIAAANEKGWQPPILLHARGDVGAETAGYIGHNAYPVHWCHLSTAEEAEAAGILDGLYPGLFTAGVTPHHLTMTDRDADFKWGWPGARMMPPLGKEADGDALLHAFNDGVIHILETDHAPWGSDHKLAAETDNPEGHDDPGCTTCFGISGIEHVLPIMMSAVKRKLIGMERLIDAIHYQPKRMLGLTTIQLGGGLTTLEIGPYEIAEADRYGQSSNNPYLGWTAWGKVTEVNIGGRNLLEDISDTEYARTNIKQAVLKPKRT